MEVYLEVVAPPGVKFKKFEIDQYHSSAEATAVIDVFNSKVDISTEDIVLYSEGNTAAVLVWSTSAGSKNCIILKRAL